MKDMISFGEMPGKVIAAVAGERTSEITIAYTDGTYTRIVVERGYDAGDEELICEEISLSDEDRGELQQLVQIGVLSADEYREEIRLRDEADADREKRRKEARRVEYEKLRKEFGGPKD